MSAATSSTSTVALVAELGRAREAAHALERLAERLDDDVLLTDELVDDEPEAVLRRRATTTT